MRTNTIIFIVISLIIGVVIGYMIRDNNLLKSSAQQSVAQNQNTASPQPGSNEAKIQNALSAAPERLRNGAMVMDFPTQEGGEMIELKKGTNGWTCFPDLASSPGEDPMCVDKQGMEWMQAYMTKQTPMITQNSIAYMLKGGSDASNTDPFATQPTAGNDWITTPAHIMVLPAQKLDPNVYGTNPNTGGPWIMWAGTPYEHLMVPIE